MGKLEHKPGEKLFVNFKEKSFTIGYSNGREQVIFPEVHTFVLPEASQIVFDIKVVHPNTKFTFIGYEFEYFKSESHFLGSHKLHNYSKYFNTYTFEVKDIPDGNYPYRYQSEVNEIQTPRTIEVRELNVDKPAKTDYSIGERIILNGNFIKDEKYFVGFNDSHLYQSFVCTKKGELFAENLSLGKVNKRLRIGYEANTSVYFPLNFDILNLGYTIENFSPKKGYRGQLMTIKGKGIHHAINIKFGSLTVEYII